ncbi:MAG: aminotransferase class V-fold PLP-dependent enzyme [Cyclobacteriaceae bacterium]|nr:aminotransferase class V-fold PLP-dependent enzyme [Cyclobacteriaceae bacterium]
MKGINFTPGPSQLYFTAEDHIRQALREGIPSLSHRTKTFEKFYQQSVDGLKELLGIPDSFFVVFTSSATEVWERIIQNLVEENSHHFVNGAFSTKFFEIAQQLNRKPTITSVKEGSGFSSSKIESPTELIALTHNETSTGVSLSMDFINSFRDQYPDALITVDAVSSLPYPQFDFSKIDSLYFSVQKGFGLPAGLGVWIVNDRCVAKAESLLSKGLSIGSYHSLPSLVSFAKKDQTPETPNVLGIYLLAQVVEDMLRRGITTIRRETEYKSAILYQALEQHHAIKPFVQEKEYQSKTVIVAQTGSQTESLVSFLQAKGLYPGDGYGKFKTEHLRFANFPAHSKETFELLVDTLTAFPA